MTEESLTVLEIILLDGDFDLREATEEQRAEAERLESERTHCISPSGILRRAGDSFNLATEAGLLQSTVSQLWWTDRRLRKPKSLSRPGAIASVAPRPTIRTVELSGPEMGVKAETCHE